MRQAQREANETNKGVTVTMRNQITSVEPDLAPLSNREIEGRYKQLLDEEKNEPLNDSESILFPKFRSKLSKNCKVQGSRNIMFNYYYVC